MSLTSEIDRANSPIRRWLEGNFDQVTALVRAVNKERKASQPTAKVVLPPGTNAGTVGTAFDYRLRYLFAATSPMDFVAGSGARLMGAFFEDEGILLADQPIPASVIESFFHYTEEWVTNCNPVARELSAQEETDLDRICYMLALFEEVRRAGLWPGSPLTSQGVTSLDDLLGLVPAPAIADLALLTKPMYPVWLPLAAKPFVLNPVFEGSTDVGGADADLIVDGTLVDIKSTTKPNLDKATVYQLLGYLFLDYTNEYQVDELGVYYSRTAELVRLPIATVFQVAASDSGKSIADYRSDLQQVMNS